VTPRRSAVLATLRTSLNGRQLPTDNPFSAINEYRCAIYHFAVSLCYSNHFSGMWLLNTSSAKLRWFNSSNDYAILSHVWSEHEDTFERVSSLAQQPIGVKKRWSRVSPKVRNCCKFAKRLGFEWVWIDTCCINKSSSAELSEAINSMYKWYSEAALCIAFLNDVRDGNDIQDPLDSDFCKSQWFFRGWTLQELIAPRHIIFVSQSWHSFGTRASLASTIEKITGIDIDVLCHQRSPMEVCAAKRMSWAALRTTTRVEDEAYSLMGLFGVNMPTIYGEGRAAFRRLQEEILKLSMDHTLFAWEGRWIGTINASRIFAISPKEFRCARDMDKIPLEDYRKAFSAFADAAITHNSNEKCQVCYLHT
jgi:hypothetical protein